MEIITKPIYTNEFGYTPVMIEHHWNKNHHNLYVVETIDRHHFLTNPICQELTYEGKKYIILYNEYSKAEKDCQNIWEIVSTISKDYPFIENSGQTRYIMTEKEFKRLQKLKKLNR